MTRRKDPQPESLQPETPPTEPFVTEVEPVTAAPSEPVAMTEPAPERPSPPPPPPRTGILGPLLGGALAAVGGFALSHFNLLGLATTNSSADVAALSAQLGDLKSSQAASLEKLGADLSALSDRVATLESAPAPATPDLSRLDGLEARLGKIEAMPKDGNASTAALTAKIADLEQRLANLPTGGSDPALQKKLDDALSRLAEAEAAATARASEAEAAAKAAARAKALDTLGDKVTAGLPYAAELQALGDTALSDALGATAETGVTSLEQLQASFPDAARAALRIARDLSASDSWSGRLVDFLAAQTGARSLTPLEGDTPDAILSRADFALSEGRIADALSALDPLDPAVRAPLGDWITQAKGHLAAIAALEAARGK